MNYYEIGQRIRKNRKALSLSQDELAEMVGISSMYMSHIETGNTKLSLPVLVSIAKALEVRTDELLFEEATISQGEDLRDITELLDSCSLRELSIIREIIKASKAALRRYDKN